MTQKDPNYIDNYVDGLSIEEVIKDLADEGCSVEYPMCDDDYPDWEDDTRVKLVDIMYDKDFN